MKKHLNKIISNQQIIFSILDCCRLMKAPKIQGKYKYFVGIGIQNILQQPQSPSKQNFQAKVQPKRNHYEGQMEKKKQNQRQTNLISLADQSFGKNEKSREAANVVPFQTRIDYNKINDIKSSKKQPLNSPINKLQAIKFEEALEKANEEKSKSAKTEGNPPSKENKKIEVYLPFSPKHQQNQFLQSVKVVDSKDFVNPYYQSFILSQRVNQQRNQFLQRGTQQKTHQTNPKFGLKNKFQEKIEEQIISGISQQKSARLYMCKMDKGQNEMEVKQVKVKLRKDNAPYLANFYQKQPQNNAMRYFQQQARCFKPQKRSGCKKTNQIYAYSAARPVQLSPYS